ncbi:MAG: nitrate- and nitrite sensing domain-containing protein [Ectothiorhodospiraceae bacterium]|nr:nitrate- and nitrite sensing domain-containing protein [Ectothiorhodospiraceae bacterium]
MDELTAKRDAADYLLASKKCDILALEQLLSMGQLVASISNLVHALQRERGISNLYGASRGQRSGDRLAGLVEASINAERAFRARLEDIDVDNPRVPGASRLFSRIAHALQGLEELQAVRGDIRALKLKPEGIIDGYSQLIQSLLAIVFEAADSAADPDISRVLVAMFHLMLGKELAGQERAVGVAGFAQGGFSEPLAERLRHLIDNQERCFQTFSHFADARSMEVWKETLSSDGAAELERLRRIAFASTGEGRANSDLSDAWFAIASDRIDAIKGVEDQVEHTLDTLSRRKVADARDDLSSHQVHIQALARQPQPGAFAIFYSAGGAPSGEAGTQAYDSGCASQQLGRSLVDLVQEQSQRLQIMSEELQEARAALAERKTIEKAKGLIMKHHQIGEEEAYRFLRQLAMAQSKKLAEVAKVTISMADILKAPGGK